MKYAIISIDESRAEKKAAIRNVCSEWTEIPLKACNAYKKEDLEQFQTTFPLKRTDWIPKIGEAGVWYSQMNAWTQTWIEGEPVVFFEDDALLQPGFIEHFDAYMKEVPEDWDMFCLFVPENQYGDFHWTYHFNDWGQHDGNPHGWWPDGEPDLLIGSDYVSKAYQGYGCVALAFSPSGAKKLLSAAFDRGMYTPVDCFIFEVYRSGDFGAYAFKPGQPRLVEVDWNAPSTIQQSEKLV